MDNKKISVPISEDDFVSTYTKRFGINEDNVEKALGLYCMVESVYEWGYKDGLEEASVQGPDPNPTIR